MNNLIKHGTEYGGWLLPKNCELDETSIIYSGGVGEDISFDAIINSMYNCNIFLIDPTRRAVNHFEEFKQYCMHKTPFTGNIQKDYYDKIKNLHMNVDKFYYESIGLWNKKDTLKFYKQRNPNYVSQSIIENMFGNEYDIVDVDTIKSLMEKHNHTKIDLLKLDIEGAEIKVLNNMLDDNIFPRYLCIEFDLKLKNKDSQNETERLMNRLTENGYKILINDDWNVTFEYAGNSYAP